MVKCPICGNPHTAYVTCEEFKAQFMEEHERLHREFMRIHNMLPTMDEVVTPTTEQYINDILTNSMVSPLLLDPAEWKRDEPDPINEYHYFEIGDRINVLCETIEEQVYKHPAMTDEQKAKVDEAMTLMQEVYQWAMKECFDFDKKGDT